MADQSRGAFEAWLKTLDGPQGDAPGYPAAHELRYPDQREAAWIAWQAACEDCAQIADSYASDVGIAQKIAAEIRGTS